MMLFKNYFISAWRNIYNHKLFSMINILGLAIGLTSCMLIALFVRDEISYDNFWANSKNIYRMHQTFLPSGRPPMEFSASAGPIVHALKKDFPQIIHASREARKKSTFIQNGRYFDEQVTLADPDFINIFDFSIIAGDLDNTINDPNGLIINHTLANKYFPNGNALGQTMTINADVFERDFKIGAIIEDMPNNSQLNTVAIIKIVEEEWKSQEWMFDSWYSVNTHLYFSLNPGSDIDEINKQMPAFIDRNFEDSGSDDPVSSFVILNSQNVKELHLSGPSIGEYQKMGSMTTVLTFSAVAILILIIASINFMNLSTARASSRAREVSLRKVMGASRKNLITQFIGESVLITLIALFTSIVMVEMALPIYNEIIGKELSFEYASFDTIIMLLLAFGVGILGGIYPALVLSGFRPAEILKTNQSTDNNVSLKLRSALVIFQFAVSITLFVSTAVVYGQMIYAKNKDLGFNKENLLIIKNLYRDAAVEKRQLLVDEYKRLPNVISVTWSNDAPGVPTENNTSLRTPDMPENKNLLIGNRTVGYDFFETYDIKMLSGRTYDINKNDQRAEAEEIRAGKGFVSSLIINETAVNRFGFKNPEDAIGKILYRPIGNNGENLIREYQIIGVAPNVYLDTLKKEIRPEMFELMTKYAQFISVRFTGSPTAIVEETRAIWEREIPSIPFEYNHTIDQLDQQYQTEQGEMTMFAAFSGLAILIACLGLYGLASFTAERRTKEIGVRKVLGARVIDIIKLLVWQFTKPVIIANLIAWPVAYYTMSIWLEGFAYRIESILILGFCILSGIAALLIAWITVAGNSMRVAMANPIKALRYE
ncbi:MAG: ABC transporter permease [Kordiimonadaceae bacterium]|nr:ABC transporter permease [Kordiimonadaceae bacterium]